MSEALTLKIAAGEVITRPTDAVKEMLENAIDATRPEHLANPDSSSRLATSETPRVEVEIRAGGLGLIRVSDNGCGIPPDELPLAFLPHATNKISSEEELFGVTTLGFRGEALATIAAISRVSAFSQVAGTDSGLLLSLEWGKVVGSEVRAGPIGTTISARELFQNVPARLRFLRSSASEVGQILSLISRYALAYPEIGFRLINDDKLTLQTPGTGRLEDALVSVYDAKLLEKLIPVEGQHGVFRISGYVAEPGTHRGNRNSVSLFVNRRLIQSRSLTYAVEEAYQPSLPSGRHPIAILRIEAPPNDVDVNIHPTKAEVRFADERSLYSAIRRLVRGAVMKSSPLPELSDSLVPTGMPVRQDRAVAEAGAIPWQPLSEPEGNDRTASPALDDIFGRPEAFPADFSQSSPDFDSYASQTDLTRSLASLEPPSGADGLDTPSAQAIAPATTLLGQEVGLPILHPLGQVQRTYIVAEGPDGVYFVDQHTAHERILYEQIRRDRARSGLASQALLSPIVVPLTPNQLELLGEGASQLRELGYSIELFGERELLLRAVPTLAKSRNPAGDLVEMIDALGKDGPEEGIDAPAALLACHSAVRAGDALTPEEIRTLLARLEGLDVWRYCPHGRPIVIKLDSAKLARDFRRI